MSEPAALLKDFLEEERLKGRREQGLIGLRTRVPKFFAFLDEYNLKLNQIGVREAQRYQGWLKEGRTKGGTPYKASTIRSFLGAVTTFYDYLKTKGLVLSNPFKEIRRQRVPKTIPQNIPKEKDLNRLLEALSRFDEADTLKQQKTRYRVHVIAELMYATGLRISEAAALRLCDVDLKRSLLTVYEGKGGKSRTAYINDYAKEVLRLFIKEIRPYIFNLSNERRETLLFGTGWAWLGHIVNRILQKEARQIGLSGFTSHGFRHALGYHLLRSGCSIRHIQQILGHKLLRNTEIYTQVDKEDLKNVLDAHHPRKFRRIIDEKA